jgi:hypothetical protein
MVLDLPSDFEDVVEDVLTKKGNKTAKSTAPLAAPHPPTPPPSDDDAAASIIDQKVAKKKKTRRPRNEPDGVHVCRGVNCGATFKKICERSFHEVHCNLCPQKQAKCEECPYIAKNKSVLNLHHKNCAAFKAAKEAKERAQLETIYNTRKADLLRRFNSGEIKLDAFLAAVEALPRVPNVVLSKKQLKRQQKQQAEVGKSEQNSKEDEEKEEKKPKKKRQSKKKERQQQPSQDADVIMADAEPVDEDDHHDADDEKDNNDEDSLDAIHIDDDDGIVFLNTINTIAVGNENKVKKPRRARKPKAKKEEEKNKEAIIDLEREARSGDFSSSSNDEEDDAASFDDEDDDNNNTPPQRGTKRKRNEVEDEDDQEEAIAEATRGGRERKRFRQIAEDLGNGLPAENLKIAGGQHKRVDALLESFTQLKDLGPMVSKIETLSSELENYTKRTEKAKLDYEQHSGDFLAKDMAEHPEDYMDEPMDSEDEQLAELSAIAGIPADVRQAMTVFELAHEQGEFKKEYQAANHIRNGLQVARRATVRNFNKELVPLQTNLVAAGLLNEVSASNATVCVKFIKGIMASFGSLAGDGGANKTKDVKGPASSATDAICYSCYMCCDPANNDKLVVPDGCSHVFCNECVLRLQTKGQCPKCKAFFKSIKPIIL